MLLEEVTSALGDDSTTFVVCRSGQEALRVVGKEKPDLAILDMQIGNMGGIATALSLEQEFEEGTTPWASILVLLDRPADVWLARRWGVDGWLVKPLDAFRLRRAAAALLAGDEYKEPSGLAV